MRKLLTLLLLVCPILLPARASQALLIDAFTTPQSVTGPLGSARASSSCAARERRGASRTIQVGGTPPASATVSVVGGSLLLGQIVSGPEVNGGVGYVPIIPADLTEAGSDTAFRLNIT